jgi:two-component system chemotaxis response regulator CheB
VGVILVSALTDRGAAATVEGLERGAFDVIRKPDGPDEKANAVVLRQLLIEKIKLFEQRPRRLPSPLPPPTGSSVSLPRVRLGQYQAVAIGTSTGGPEALAHLLPVLTRQSTVPLLIVQHIIPGMTGFLAESLGRKCAYRVVEASDGQVIEPSTAYIGPQGKHMIVRKQQNRTVIGLIDQPPENGFRPSVDVLFRSVAAVYGQSAVAVVLTGMGTDGAKGIGPLNRAGAYIIAQDEATSVVWGMPRAAVATNLVDAVLPLDRIGKTVAAMIEPG